jgi:hypothetical protein
VSIWFARTTDFFCERSIFFEDGIHALQNQIHTWLIEFAKRCITLPKSCVTTHERGIDGGESRITTREVPVRGLSSIALIPSGRIPMRASSLVAPGPGVESAALSVLVHTLRVAVSRSRVRVPGRAARTERRIEVSPALRVRSSRFAVASHEPRVRVAALSVTTSSLWIVMAALAVAVAGLGSVIARSPTPVAWS